MLNHSELISVLRAAGLDVKHIEGGKLTRCKTIDDKAGQQSGWYRVFDDLNTTVCIFGNWKDLSRGVWVEGNRNQTPRQRADVSLLIERAKVERKKEQSAQWALNHTKLLKLWAETKPLHTDDPPLSQKMSPAFNLVFLTLGADGVKQCHPTIISSKNKRCVV